MTQYRFKHHILRAIIPIRLSEGGCVTIVKRHLFPELIEQD